jgi:hypothetical protein
MRKMCVYVVEEYSKDTEQQSSVAYGGTHLIYVYDIDIA